MIKNSFKLIVIAVLIGGFIACTLPSSVEVRMQPDVAFPIGPDNGNLSEVLMGFIRDALETAKKNGTVNFAAYKDYKVENKAGNKVDAQTLLIQYNIMDQVLNFAEEMGDFTSMMDQFEKIDIDLSGFENIDLSKMSSFGGGSHDVEVDISVMLTNTKSTLETSINKHVAKDVPVKVGIGQNLDEIVDVFHFTIDDLDDITFKEGTLSIDIKLKGYGGNTTAGANFYFEKVQIKDIAGNEIPGTGTNGSQQINFSAANSEDTISFNLQDETLHSDFWIEFKGFKDNTAQANAKIVALHIESPILSTNTKVRGATNYISDEDIESHEIGQFEIKFSFDKNFLHAQIGKGVLEFNLNPPKDKTPGNTWIELHDGIIPDMYIFQNVVNDLGIWNGLSDATGSSGNSSVDWHYTDAEAKDANNLLNKHINSNEKILVKQNSKVILPKGGAVSFMLSDADLVSKTVPVNFTPNVNISEFALMDLRAEELLEIDQPKPISLAKAADYIKWIHFTEVGVQLNFGQIDIEGLEVMISEEHLEINHPGEQFEPITENGNAKFINENFKLEIEDKNITELQFKIELNHNNTAGGVLTLENVDLTKGKLKMEIGYDFFFRDDWDEALVDFSHMDKNETFPVDGLSAINDNLEGFTINNIRSYLYIDGPDSLFGEHGMDPTVDLIVEYEGTSKTPPLLYTPDPENGKFPFERNPIPDLGDSGVYAKPIPDGNQRPLAEGIPLNFDQIINDLPEGVIKIHYTVSLKEIHINQDIYKDLIKPDSSDMKVAAIIVLPMSLEAGEDGAAIKIPNMFEGYNDIFGRTGGDGFSFMDIIKRLSLNIGLTHAALAGGELYMTEEGETSGKEVLRFDLSGNAMNIPIDGNKLDAINNKNPYKIIDMGIRFGAGRELIIPSDLRMLSIGFDAEIIYVYDF